MHCTSCGQLLPNTAPKFCPHCGTPVVPFQSRAWNDPANKPVWISVGLFLGAWLLWGDGPSPGLLPALAWLASIVLIVLDTAAPAWWVQLSRPAWMRRPLLGSIASGVFVLATALTSGLSIGFILWTAATAVFLKDAFRRGELGAFDPRLLWRGWRLLLLIGIALASFTFAASWEPTVNVSGYTSYEHRWDGEYRVWNSGFSMGGKNNAHDQGAATVPSLMMLTVLVWAAYTGTHPAARWGRYLPVIFAPILIIWAFRWSLPPDWVKTNDMAYGMQAEGPGYFIFLLLPYYVGAVALALGKDHWRRTV
ncbi:MAG TPA: zinc ribbon domain-containing protein [Symbiobacteriaceae bacterium]|nr:zinc ribbon domain-containing protein [Symbiobacteriaceae bacterium]